MSRLPNFNTSQWFLSDPEEEPWKRKAACKGRINLPWVNDFQPQIDDLETMRRVCSTCEAIRDCADFAINSNDGAGVDGGFYAGVWIPWRSQSGNPAIVLKEQRRKARTTIRRILTGKPIEAPRRRARSDYRGRSKPVKF